MQVAARLISAAPAARASSTSALTPAGEIVALSGPLVEPSHVQDQPVQVHACNCREPLRLRGCQYRIDRLSNDVVGHEHTMAAAEVRPFRELP